VVKNLIARTQKTDLALRAYLVKVKQHKPVQIDFAQILLINQSMQKMRALETVIAKRHVVLDAGNRIKDELNC